MNLDAVPLIPVTCSSNKMLIIFIKGSTDVHQDQYRKQSTLWSSETIIKNFNKYCFCTAMTSKKPDENTGNRIYNFKGIWGLIGPLLEPICLTAFGKAWLTIFPLIVRLRIVLRIWIRVSTPLWQSVQSDTFFFCKTGQIVDKLNHHQDKKQQRDDMRLYVSQLARLGEGPKQMPFSLSSYRPTP